ncbi:MAG: ankyrin repeat domain-containing protein [Legionella sp.]|nr:ankyrin repeat domain-containing protein [Legionella sp.]
MSVSISEQKLSFVNETIVKLRQQLNKSNPKNTLQSLEQFENQLTLNEIEACLTDSKPEELHLKLTHLLSERWERTRNTNMCYTQQPNNLVNQLCLAIAKTIAPPATNEEEIAALALNTGPYCLLMPSLKNTEDVYGENIHSIGLHEFVLSDNECVFIPLAQCVHQASISDEGLLRQVVAIDGNYPKLTPSEIERVTQHSKQAKELYDAIIALNKQRLLGDDIGAQLNQLANALRGGGSHGTGSELNAGAAANLGILKFSAYWDALPQQKKSAILSDTPELKDILGRLFRPDDVNYKETRFCVELLAGDLDPIIAKYNNKASIQTLTERVLKKETAFNTALQNPRVLTLTPKNTPPKHILHLIFKLDKNKQRALFKKQGYENALQYALGHEPEALIEFELDEASKQQALSARFKSPYNMPALLVAAQQGKIEAIELLLSWGAPIESQDANQSTALHWAASYGHVDAVQYLLEQGASIKAGGHNNTTPLSFAILNGQRDIVQLLLQKNAPVNLRDNLGANALDLAIEKHPEFIDPILMHIATLSVEQQAECLLNAPKGPYPNVLFYAAANKPSLFDALVDKVLEQPSPELKRAVFTASNEQGWTPLILAAQIGAGKSVRKLVESGINCDAPDLNNSTALHWAAQKGQVDTVRYLLEKGFLLEAQGYQTNTPLHCAVLYGKRAVIELLLQKNAQVNSRNIHGKNALDIAIANHPGLIEPILMQIATLPVEEQAECLLNVPNGPYPNVLFYAAANKPTLFDALVDKVLEHPDPAFHRLVFTAANEKGETPLILAAQLGMHKSISKLLKSGINIESHDSNNNTALHWAANNGHADSVNCLLENGASLETKGVDNNSALNFAVMHGKSTVMELLLKKNAPVNTRSSHSGKNALDFAIVHHPELIEPIIKHIATLPETEQTACLLKVSGGLYSNALLYCAIEKPNLLNDLLLLNPAISAKNDLQSRASLLTTMQHCDEHLQRIGAHYQKMKEKSHNNPKYTAAVTAAETLLRTCAQAKITLFESDGDTKPKILAFQKICKDAVDTAKPVLEKHREWGKMLGEFLLALITLPVSLPLYAIGFFSVKTKSAQLLDKLEKGLDNPASPRTS